MAFTLEATWSASAGLLVLFRLGALASRPKNCTSDSPQQFYRHPSSEQVQDREYPEPADDDIPEKGSEIETEGNFGIVAKYGHKFREYSFSVIFPSMWMNFRSNTYRFSSFS
jgi:hypothetical protein